jgi:type II secretory pathway component GspD/PulD (secretin)
MKTSFRMWLGGVALLSVLFVVPSAVAQDPFKNMPPEVRAKAMEEMRKRGMNPGMMPGQNQPPQGEQKPEEKKDGEKPAENKGGETKTIKRPDKPPTVDPNRAKLTPDKDGRVQFNYMGQPWSDVLQDYADAAKLSFDWQELPSDYLNLTTQRKYTLLEARDLLNRHLISRGFTMINQGELLSIVKIENLDSSLIPEIGADDLDSHMPHEFVRVRFTLPPAMDPTKAKEDVASLLRPNAKVTPLLETKRLLVIDTVGNLRNVRDLIYAEQAAASSIIKPKVYQIRYRRADYVADQIMIVLGMDKDKRQSPQEQMMAQQQQMQQMQQMQEMMQRGGGGNKDMAKMMMKDEPKVFITVDRSQNTLLVNAPPDLIPVIDRTIAELDVAKQDFAVGSPGQDNGARYMEKYSTVTANPETVVTALQDIGNLHPLTQLQSDTKAKTIYAYATITDHATIKRMIASLDGSGRKAEVIWLPKRLPADQVAGSIMSLLSGEGEKKDDDDNFPFYFFRNNNNDDDEPETAFRVLPDLENNRIILWATENEMVEVRTLIAKLSERADGTLIGADRVRVLDTRSPEATQRLLERLNDSWTGENELEVEIPEGGIAPREEDDAKDDEVEEGAAEKEKDRVTMRVRSPFHLAQVTTEKSPAEPAPARKPKPKVKVTVNDEGQLVIISDDPAAIEQMQELIDQLAPPEPEFRHYRLTYITSEDMKEILETYFADVLAEDSEPILDWWGRVRNNNDKKEEPATLGKQRKLRIIEDYWTNTLIISNASPTQLRLIEDMIGLYDIKQKPQGFPDRMTVTIKVKYSRASDIAKSLKEVYADLLSSKDKEFQGREGEQSSSIQRSQRYMFGDAEDPIRFEGIVSLGVDEVSNSLIVSAPKGVIDSVKETVSVLDEAAQPNTVVEVHEIRGMISPEQLQRAVMRAMSEPWVGGKPVSQLNANQQNQNQDQRREGGWDRRQGRGGRGGGRGGNN